MLVKRRMRHKYAEQSCKGRLSCKNLTVQFIGPVVAG
jgi:hypothetical protein